MSPKSCAEVSVIICSHDPRQDHLSRTLDALRAQTLSLERWELVLVDNASKRALSDIWDLSWHPNARHIREERLGLTFARVCSIEATSTEVLIFVDDDNVLAANYLEAALQVGRDWPMLGTWGAQQLPEFERDVDEFTRHFWSRELTQDHWSNVPRDRSSLPAGAGMCVRRQVAEAHVRQLKGNPARYALGRRGTSLSSSEDIDLALTSCDLGLGNGMFMALSLIHLIPNRRTEDSYILKLIEGMACSDVLLDYLRGQPPHRPSRAQKLLRWYEALHVSERDLRVDRAKNRGRELAIMEIARLEHEQNTANSRQSSS